MQLNRADLDTIERTTLERLAGELKLELGAIDQALAEAAQALNE